jgi:glucosyl-dolichyl phosphate glucuronosyltransferase
MLASVIVPTCDLSPHLSKALISVVREIQKTAIECELLAVYNGPGAGKKVAAESVAKQFSEIPIRYINEPTPGLLSGRHRGALEARGDVLLFIDDDVEVSENWLAAIVDVFSDPTVQLCGGKSLPIYESPPPDWMQNFWFQPPYGGRACVELSLLDLGERPIDVDATYIWGLNYAIRKKALFDLGGFNPDVLPERLQHLQGDGETGLSSRANAAGYRTVYVPAVDVYHYVPTLRMTPNYWQKRHFYQGVCDSYTHIRAARSAFHDRSDHAEQAPNGGKSPSTLAEEIRLKCTAAYRDGFRFHQRAVSYSSELLEWVVRPNYWDYRLPDLRLPKRLRRPEKP